MIILKVGEEGGGGGNSIVFHLRSWPTSPASVALNSKGQEPQVACEN